MTKIALSLTLPAVLLACALSAPAQAQSRTYTVVSAPAGLNGLPSPGPCGSVQAPCRTLQGAFAVTAAGGVIDVISPGEYGPLNITGPISIQGHGWASVTAASGNAITVNAGANDKINIRGVLLDGLGTSAAGINFISGRSLNLQDSSVRDNADGIIFSPSNGGDLFVSNTVVSDNSIGIFMSPGSGTVQSVLDHVALEQNSFDGLLVQCNENTIINLTVDDSVIASSGQYGMSSSCSAGADSYLALMMRNTTVHSSGNIGVYNQGSSATVYLTRSTITANATGWANGGTLLSYDDNNIDANSAGNTAPTTTPYK